MIEELIFIFIEFNVILRLKKKTYEEFYKSIRNSEF